MTFRSDERTHAQPGDVSVVIPVYNHARWVKAAVESALRQSVKPREVICIDDGSTDESPATLEAIAAREPTVSFRIRPNRGAHNTLNEGIAAASSSCVAILNSDDLYHPSRLKRGLRVMDADPGVAIVASAVAVIDASGHAIEDAWYKEAVAFHRRCGDLGLSLANANFLFSTSNIVARKSLFDEIGYFSDMRYAHDLDFLLRVVAKSKRIVILPEKLLYYRRHGSNTISESHAKVRQEWATSLANFARSAASGPDPERRTPSYLDRLFEIAESHSLLRQVSLALRDAR